MAAINHNYPLDNALLVVDETNEPIEGAVIKIFENTAFLAGDVDTWVGATTSDIEGKWVAHIDVNDGETYIVYIEKYSEYGPSYVEITT